MPVTIPYQAGLLFPRPECGFGDDRNYIVTIPYQSGLTFPPIIVVPSTEIMKNGVTIPYQSGLTFPHFSDKDPQKALQAV